MCENKNKIENTVGLLWRKPTVPVLLPKIDKSCKCVCFVKENTPVHVQRLQKFIESVSFQYG